MANAIFTTSESSAYDDQPESRYHFPATYQRVARAVVGDWIVYYEPRRNAGQSSVGGRQAYFAMARVDEIEADSSRADLFYARMSGYIEFDRAVPFRENALTYESMLTKEDGSTNRGRFGRSVREISSDEFVGIVRAGFSRDPEMWEESLKLREPAIADYGVRPTIEQWVTRPFRDAAFRRHVRNAYENTCAVTGLRLVNGGGRPEVQAAHIRPVEANGPDSVRNGIALTGTAHWLFDRGLISLDESYRVLVSPHGVPDDLSRLITPGKVVRLPAVQEYRPHQSFLQWHRSNRFKC